jgi:hypothetical protein
MASDGQSVTTFIELAERYCEAAARRLQQALREDPIRTA